jgi:hypothetical protein
MRITRDDLAWSFLCALGGVLFAALLVFGASPLALRARGLAGPVAPVLAQTQDLIPSMNPALRGPVSKPAADTRPCRAIGGILASLRQEGITVRRSKLFRFGRAFAVLLADGWTLVFTRNADGGFCRMTVLPPPAASAFWDLAALEPEI